MDFQILIIRAFCYGGGIIGALVCMLLAARKDVRGAFKVFFWIIAIMLLVMQAGCWVLVRGLSGLN